MAASVRLFSFNNNSVILQMAINRNLMAYRCISSAASIIKHQITGNNSSHLHHGKLLQLRCMAKPHVPVRFTNFFNRRSSQDLWKSVVSVSNQGAKKGRGRGAAKKMTKDLNRGQIIGVGAVNMVWPGLNAPVLRGQELVSRQQLEPDADRERRLRELRDNMGQQRHMVLHPLERGWSGVKMGGRRVGPPDAIGDDKFEGFDSIVLEFKTVCLMTGNLGRRRRVSVLTVTGNGEGIVGFGLAKALKPHAALRVAKNKAGQQLVYIDRYNNHTVMHDFYSQFGITKLFVKKVPEGHGLVCHRVIAAICKMVGIKDIHAKVEGSINVQHITKAFILGLIRQKSFQELSEEKKLHLVEMREEHYDYPRVVASPSTVRTTAQLPPNENIDFKIHVLDGRVALEKKKWPPFYTRLPGWETHLKKYRFYRNKEQVRSDLLKEYGFVRSFLWDQHPECHGVFLRAKPEEEDLD